MGSNNSPKKTVVILWDQAGQLANELWNYMSVFAYCLEKRYELKNYAFYKYGRFFNIPVGNPLVDYLYFKTFSFYQSLLPGRLGRHFSDLLYRYGFAQPMKRIKKSRIVNGTECVKYLPPTRKSEPMLRHLEQDISKVIYFYGGLFRNTVGLEKYRQGILHYFQYPKSARAKVQGFITSLRSRYRYLVGIHIRQTDYRVYRGGRYYVTPQETAVIARQYLKYLKRSQTETCFIICSDGAVDLQCFGDLNVVRSHGNLIEDLLVLASSDVIL